MVMAQLNHDVGNIINNRGGSDVSTTSDMQQCGNEQESIRLWVSLVCIYSWSPTELQE